MQGASREDPPLGKQNLSRYFNMAMSFNPRTGTPDGLFMSSFPFEASRVSPGVYGQRFCRSFDMVPKNMRTATGFRPLGLLGDPRLFDNDNDSDDDTAVEWTKGRAKLKKSARARNRWRKAGGDWKDSLQFGQVGKCNVPV